MNDAEFREDARLYFIPFILGNNSNARKLSRKIYRRYGVSCFILDKKRSLSLLFYPSCRFLKLTEAQSSVLTAIQLTDLAKQSPYTLPLLIPCSTEYQKITNDNRELLEPSFVISSEELALTDSPLNVIP